MDNKFIQSLKMNAIPEWWNSYISFESLTLLITKLEHERQARMTFADEENTLSLQELDFTFMLALNTQLEKVTDFFNNTETSLYSRLDSVLNVNPWNQQQQDSSIDIDDSGSSTNSSNGATIHSHGDFLLSPLADLQKKQLGDLYISLVNLTTFVELNWTGFDKILRDYDQRMDRQLQSNFLAHLKTASHPFMSGTMTGLCNKINKLLQYYAHAFCDDKIHMATRQMNTYYAAERDTNALDQQWEKQQTIHKNEMYPKSNPTMDKNNHTTPADRQSHFSEIALSVSSYGNNHPPLSFSFCGVAVSIPKLNISRRHVCLLLAVVIFIVLMNVNCFGNRQENACFALLVFAAVMWATEAIPLYATSMGLPFLIVILGVMRNKTDGTPMSASAASKEVFGAMFSSTIMMLLGGFCLASSLGKYGIAKAFATHVLSRAGTRPRWILLAIMLVSGFLSMWISNVATPVLCFSLMEPILDSLVNVDDEVDNATNEKTAKVGSSRPSVVASSLILGIALASCIGGMTSPISSPQNIITLEYLSPSPGWGIWFIVSMPISILCIFVCWFLLLIVYRPDSAMPHIHTTLSTKEGHPSGASLFRTQVAVMVITVLTIGLWCAETTLANYLGSTGIVATLPMFLFFGSGLLNKDDLNGFLWSVIVLAQGGMALGEAVTSSGLLQDIALRIKSMVDHLDVMVILVIFSVLVLIFATFVSHTVAALIIIPIIQQVGQQLPVPHPNLLVMGAGLACSTGMALPVSGFPNMVSSQLEDKFGRRYLTTRDFLVIGVPTSVFCCLLVVTMGYGVMMALGF